MNIVSNFFKTAGKTFIKNKPAIMTGIALVSLGTTVVMAMKEGPKIKEVVEEKKAHIDRIKNDDRPDVTEADKQDAIKKEVLDGAKKLAVPVAKVGLAVGITVFAIFGINKAHTAREVAASALLETYKNQVIGYEEKLPELVGKKKAEEIRHDVLVDSAEKMAESKGTNKEFYKTIDYQTVMPCMDCFGNRWTSSREDLDKAINSMEREKLHGGRGLTPVNYADFLAEYFDNVALTESAADMFFDPGDYSRIEVTPYEDNFIKTTGYLVNYDCGKPVNEKYIDGIYS